MQNWTDTWFAQLLVEDMRSKGKEGWEIHLSKQFTDNQRENFRLQSERVVAKYAADCLTTVEELRGW